MRHRAVRAVILAAASGLLLGVAARLVMRFVALESGVAPGFSLGGSLEVVVFGALIGMPVALLFFVLRPRVQPRWPWPGLACGLLLFAVLAAAPPPAARSALADTPDTPAATAFAFALLLAAWGVALEALYRRVLAPRRG